MEALNRILVVIAIAGLAPAALAETIGSSEGGGSFMFNKPQTAPVVVKKELPPVSAEPVELVEPEIVQEKIPLPPKRPVVIPVSDLPNAPYKPSLMENGTSCPDPVAHPNARNTPVKVYVDQHTQTVEIDSPDIKRPLKPEEVRVSTGGGLKIPNGQLKKAPYCARTPAKDRIIISAVTEDMFKGTGCTADEIRSKSTVFPMYHTRTFTDKKGNPIPMPNAIRIVGGIFFHEVPPSYSKMLGHNVSGECVRMAPKTAAFLQAQIKKYGAIEVTISEPPMVAREMPQYCDEQMVAHAREYGSAPRNDMAGYFPPAPQATGTEDVYGGQDNFFTLLNRALNPRRNRPVARQRQDQVQPQFQSTGGLY